MANLNSGDTALVLMSAALVALMTPGLAFFYGGLVRRKNVLSIMMQSFISMGVVTILAISVIVFAGTELLPGDVVTAVLGQGAANVDVMAIRQQLHLDRPAPERYLRRCRSTNTPGCSSRTGFGSVLSRSTAVAATGFSRLCRMADSATALTPRR